MCERETLVNIELPNKITLPKSVSNSLGNVFVPNGKHNLQKVKLFPKRVISKPLPKGLSVILKNHLRKREVNSSGCISL